MATRILAEGLLLLILGGAVVLFYRLIFKLAEKEDAKTAAANKESKTNGSE